MSGHHPFSHLTKDFTPERRRRVDGIVRELLAEMPLHKRSAIAKQWVERLKMGIGYMARLGLSAGKSEEDLRSCAQGITAVVMAEYMALDEVERAACARWLLAELEEPLQRAGLVVDECDPGQIHELIAQASFSLLLQGQRKQWGGPNDLDSPDSERIGLDVMWRQDFRNTWNPEDLERLQL